MRILLIQPPIEDFYDTDIRLQPIGLGYLKASASRHCHGVDVLIRDYHQGHRRFAIPIPRELGYLKDYYEHPDKSPFRVFYQYFHFGASFAYIERDLAELRPDVIGISALFTPYFREALQIAKISKKMLPDVAVLMGGSHVSACPEEVLANDEVDFIIRGEGERGFVEWVEFLQGRRPIDSVSSLGYKLTGQLKLNPVKENFPIDDIAVPDLSDLHLEHYQFAGKNLIFLLTSRSCPHQCSFCSVHQTFGRSYRRRSIDNVMAEIHQRYREGYRIIDFEDDNLTFYKKEMKALCRRIIHEFPGGGLEFVAMNGISYISMDDELLVLMQQAGFTHLNLALVTSDKFVREATKRPHTIEKYLQVVGKAYALGFKIVSYQILGLPNERIESMIQTLCFAARLPVLLGASMFYLTPNTPIAENFAYRDEKDRFLARLTSMHIETENFKREDMFTLFITTRIIDFLKSFALPSDIALHDLLAASWPEKPQARGVLLLNRLFDEKQLYADVGNGYKRIKKFRYELFTKVFSQLAYVTTQNGRRITDVAGGDKQFLTGTGAEAVAPSRPASHLRPVASTSPLRPAGPGRTEFLYTQNCQDMSGNSMY